jgi:hypothetical protein
MKLRILNRSSPAASGDTIAPSDQKTFPKKSRCNETFADSDFQSGAFCQKPQPGI